MGEKRKAVVIEEAKPKVPRACMNCRKQKMKCNLEGEPPCRRCRNAGVSCVFKIRANGVDNGDWHISDLSTPASNPTSQRNFQSDVLARLSAIETRLGMNAGSPRTRGERGGDTPPIPSVDFAVGMETFTSPDNSETPDATEQRSSLPDLWATVNKLSTLSDSPLHEAWQPEVVEALWMAFAENMPAMHFSTHRIFQGPPTPILLAAVLYAAAMQHPLTRFASLASFYRSAAAQAIAQLAIPAPIPASPSLSRTISLNQTPIPDADKTDSDSMGNALGIIITELMSEGWVNPTGIWIAIAYQIIVANAATCGREQAMDWKGIYEGLRVVDIEHASLRLACPILPLIPPLANLKSHEPRATADVKQAYPDLITIMHVGLSHFSGRRLPTIIETVLGDVSSSPASSSQLASCSDNDAHMIQGWAKELDKWLFMYHKPSGRQQRGPSDANIILLQYQLHKLFVLSLYHPGHEATQSFQGQERKELLASARATLQLQRMGLSIWSNWDLVIITYAALIVIENLKAGETNREDHLLVQGHVNALRSTHQPAPSLRHSLSARLEARLKLKSSSSNTPDILPSDFLFANSGADDYLPIFNSDAEARVLSTLGETIGRPAECEFGSSNVTGPSQTLSVSDRYDTTDFVPPGGLSWTFGDQFLDDEGSGIGWPPAFNRMIGTLSDNIH